MDFTGFYFDNIHSSTYNLLRVSDGSRYSKNLLPDFENKEVDLVGRDEDLYESQKYKKTEQTIKVAFDKLTEQNFRDLKQWLGSKELKEFRFDEEPYKSYWAKLSSPPKFDTICFLEEDLDDVLTSKKRIYKGEGELNFIFYNGFGSCNDNSTVMTEEGLKLQNGVNWQILSSYIPFNVMVDNVNEWGEVSGLKSNAEEMSIYNSFGNTISNEEQISQTCQLYNPGDFDTDFLLYIQPSTSNETIIKDDRRISIQIWPAGETASIENSIKFVFSLKDCYQNDKFLLDTKKHSLKRINVKGKELRYDLVKSSHWPAIPKGEWQMKITIPFSGITPKIDIKYNYKYY